jgi:hypothetical protein
MRNAFLHRRGVRGAVCLVLLLSLAPLTGLAQRSLEAPQTLEEAKGFGLNIIEQLPSKMSEIFQNEVLPLWKKIFDWFAVRLAALWENTAKDWIQGWIDRIKELLGQEIEARKPGIQQSFQEEKQELKENIGELSLWERFKSLIFN